MAAPARGCRRGDVGTGGVEDRVVALLTTYCWACGPFCADQVGRSSAASSMAQVSQGPVHWVFVPRRDTALRGRVRSRAELSTNQCRSL
eukprot:483781-Rhodomonas_salina.3